MKHDSIAESSYKISHSAHLFIEPKKVLNLGQWYKNVQVESGSSFVQTLIQGVKIGPKYMFPSILTLFHHVENIFFKS